jgi:hypothetical protein
VKPRATHSASALRRRFDARLRELELAALDAAATALGEALARTREREGLRGPLRRAAPPHRRSVGADDPESLARELGSPGHAPAPWLAPSLPGARAPMRAAVVQAAARALSRSRT